MNEETTAGTDSSTENVQQATTINEEDMKSNMQTTTNNYETTASKMLFRHPKDKMLGGVCGGLANYLGWDPVLVRILWVVGTLATSGGGFVAYIALSLLLPVGTASTGQLRPATIELNQRNLSRVAYVLIGLGGLILLSNIGVLSPIWRGFWSVMGTFFWPAVLIILGYTLLSNADKKKWQSSASTFASKVRSGGSGSMPSSDSMKSRFLSARERMPLKRSRTERVFLGVCGGIGQRFNVDPNLVRLIWAAFSIGSIGMGVLVYVATGLFLPEGGVNPAANQADEAHDVEIIDGTVEVM